MKTTLEKQALEYLAERNYRDNLAAKLMADFAEQEISAAVNAKLQEADEDFKEEIKVLKAEKQITNYGFKALNAYVDIVLKSLQIKQQ